MTYKAEKTPELPYRTGRITNETQFDYAVSPAVEIAVFHAYQLHKLETPESCVKITAYEDHIHVDLVESKDLELPGTLILTIPGWDDDTLEIKDRRVVEKDRIAYIENGIYKYSSEIESAKKAMLNKETA